MDTEDEDFFNSMENNEQVEEDSKPKEKEGSNHYSKYQFSYFTNDRDQVVIRCNNSVEFKNAIDAALRIVPKNASTMTAKAPVAQQTSNVPSQQESAGFCSIHGVQLLSAISKKTGNSYQYHDGANGEGRCFKKGYMPSQR